MEKINFYRIEIAPAERALLTRRRFNKNQTEYYGSQKIGSRIENGHKLKIPERYLGDLMPHIFDYEIAYLLRRRAGDRQIDCAAKLKFTKQFIIVMEKGWCNPQRIIDLYATD